MQANPTAETSVPRPGQSMVSFFAVVLIAVLVLGDSVLRGDWVTVIISAAPTLLVIWAAWILLFRPAIRFDRDKLTIYNPLRVITVPWSRVADISQRFQVVLELDDGKKVTCWGSPFPDKPGARRQTPQRAARALISTDVASTLRGIRASAPPATADAVVVRRLDLAPAIIGAAIVVACLVEAVFAL